MLFFVAEFTCKIVCPIKLCLMGGQIVGLFVSPSLQMIQVYGLLTDPVVLSVTRFFGPAVLPCYDTVFCSAVNAWFTVSPTENHEEETVEVSPSLSEKRCC